MKAKDYTILLVVFSGAFFNANAQTFQYPFQNHNLTFEQRVDDLVSRLTLEEKVSQMLNGSPAIPRFGIPAYDWWNETLHGVARTPFNVTVFPQAIAMAATFNPSALLKMGDYCATEGRAIHNKAIAMGKTRNRYWGLTYWTPNINIFRDPRWGRGQETYGEDPYLTGELGDAFVRGLQGDDPKYLKAAACAKHYAIHSGPEPQRHNFNVDVSAYDLWDTYLPAFKKLVTESKSVGVMCAYNAFRAQPCCASDILMIDILRNRWNFKGYVTSDCRGIDDFYTKHKTHPDAESAATDAVYHGTDIECGPDTYKTLVSAVKNGKMTEKQIDISVKRLFMIRFQLGMFDPVEKVKYAQTQESVLEAPEHRAHALSMARESMVLLKNKNKTLPLSKKLNKIVVLGPNADNTVSILGNYNGFPSRLSTVVTGIKEKVGSGTTVVYEKAVNYTNNTILIYSDITHLYTMDGRAGIRAEYFNNKELAGEPVATVYEKELDHFWQEGVNVTENLMANDFSARYSTSFKAVDNIPITFELEADDACRVMINGKVTIDTWSKKMKEAQYYNLEVKKDSVYNLVIEYWQGGGKGNIKLSTGNYVRTEFKELIQRHNDADVFIFAGGISPQLEGESMKVTDPGFKGGDRTSILLPEIQTELMKALHSTGKPVVFVMMTGSAIATPWESENVPAILNAWYGGQAAGDAIADILFGDYNPSGRLPVTFYKGDEDLPPFENYSMENRTYRYFKGMPQYAFGYGLSFSTFRYDELTISAIKVGRPLTVSVRVMNTSNTPGDEVVQLYLVNQDTTVKAPLKALKGFKRISLLPSESKTVEFILSAEDLMHVDAEGNLRPFEKDIEIAVGGNQPGETNPTNGNSVSKRVNVRKLVAVKNTSKIQ